MAFVDLHQPTRDLERALCTYTGAPYAVVVNSCTNALLLACAYHKVRGVTIPKRTYVSVPQSIIHAGGTVQFDDRTWVGTYQLRPYPIWDSARWFSSGMYQHPGQAMCISFHRTKTLGYTQGGAILTDSGIMSYWLRLARFDGRSEGIEPKNDHFRIVGWHCYIDPEVSSVLLKKLAKLPKDNLPLPNDDYPDLSLTDWNNL